MIYDAVVITDEIDPNKAGAVRVKIIGVTDSFEDKDQPFVLPCPDRHMAVPTKGSWLRVELLNNDINQGQYTHVSCDESLYPNEYRDDYPNVAKTNLGSPLFKMIHYRDSRETRITHDSSSFITWDSNGVITHDSDLAYGNSGYGANNDTGQRVQAVLTGGTIDIFCCTPVSSRNGSEYLWVPHVSIQTANATPEVTAQPEDMSQQEQPMTRPLNGGTIEFIESQNKVVVGERNITWLVVCMSGGNDFISIHKNVLDSEQLTSYHYIVGKSDANAATNTVNSAINMAISSTRNADENESPNGLAQFVELNDLAYFGSNDKINGVNVSKNAISVCLIGTGGKLPDVSSGPTDYQYNILKDILTQVRQTFGDNVMLATTEDFEKPKSMGLFDYKRVL